MLAPPAPPAPVASSKPPSPFGPAHNQADRCKLVIIILTGLQTWIASGTGTGHPCVDLVVNKLHLISVRRTFSAIRACYASDTCFPDMQRQISIPVTQTLLKWQRLDNALKQQSLMSIQCVISDRSIRWHFTSMHTGHANLAVLPLIQGHPNRAFKMLLNLHCAFT